MGFVIYTASELFEAESWWLKQRKQHILLVYHFLMDEKRTHVRAWQFLRALYFYVARFRIWNIRINHSWTATASHYFQWTKQIFQFENLKMAKSIKVRALSLVWSQLNQGLLAYQETNAKCFLFRTIQNLRRMRLPRNFLLEVLLELISP